MKNRFNEFLALHHKAEAVQIGNVWNAQSAQVYDKLNFAAIGTSSAAVASSLGFADGEEMSFEDYLFVIKRIAATTSAMLTVDLEAGCADTPEEICNNITKLNNIGVAGINIEDSIVTDGKRSIVDANNFAAKLKQITSLLTAAGVEVFINVRADSFLLGLPNALEDALARTKLYQDTGVHGLFFPCITQIADIEKITALSRLPVNVMCIPGLPDFKALQDAGVKRISAGPFLNMNIYKALETSIEKITAENSFASLFN
ncbi:isocitrate lyase/phosphoenolpyruvate mutase family protein [Mucilaginibacter sp. cycad4]|uniref:isocitrate lyase/PEP mutase family protein n=1 Tax=Mucilaginibacter sp. cycad4 TaxID=3342096 RepID=UPI002AAB7AC5|nr:isocitrate lyase/phosphoenolpyruvate mutase family protein [Mucilaginibacter gossypii]WPU97419.1 isocitrate lyase/phosphoenolpyruvate mutase family protein [Mucilaginibacter gossypii]